MPAAVSVLRLVSNNTAPIIPFAAVRTNRPSLLKGLAALGAHAALGGAAVWAELVLVV